MSIAADRDGEKVTKLAKFEESAAPTDFDQGGNKAKNQMEKLMVEIFSNALIWRTLGSYLNPSDLKCCRLVDRNFNRMVMDETNFRSKVILKVRKEKVKPEDFGKTIEKWKRISLKVSAVKASDPSNYKWLCPLLKEVNFLCLKLQERESGRRINVHPILGMLVSACPKLKSLALEPAFIRFGSGGEIFQGNETLKNLEQLEILKPNYLWDHFQGPFSDSPAQEKNEALVVKEFCDVQSVKIYKSYFVIKSPFNGPEHQYYNELDERTSTFLNNLSHRIIANNREHLESHPFYDIFQFNSEEDMLFGAERQRDRYDREYHETPALKCLQTDVTQLYAKFVNVVKQNWNFLDYFTSRPPLVQLEIFYPVDNPASTLFWTSFVKALANHAPTLKKLKLLASFFQGFDWTPMRHSHLTDIRLEDVRDDIVRGDLDLEEFRATENNNWIREALVNLPETARRVYLKGAEGLKARKKLQVEDFSQLDPKLVDQLTIFNSGGSVTNEVVRFICSNFKLLRKLNLSDSRTDDRGFKKISELKGLQYLTLRHCRISNKTLLTAIRFKELRYFDLSRNPRLTVPRIRFAMRQCPNLEILIVSGRPLNFTEVDGKKICPRFKGLVQMDVGLADLV